MLFSNASSLQPFSALAAGINDPNHKKYYDKYIEISKAYCLPFIYSMANRAAVIVENKGNVKSTDFT